MAAMSRGFGALELQLPFPLRHQRQSQPDLHNGLAQESDKIAIGAQLGSALQASVNGCASSVCIA